MLLFDRSRLRRFGWPGDVLIDNDSASGLSLEDRSLWERFASKATAVGATMSFSADTGGANSVVGHEPGDHAAAGLFAVAETGSVVIGLPRDDRSACFLAERLWLLVPAGDIVSTLDEALARIARMVDAGRPYVTLMTGPSRTADIERTLTIGVHGPRELHIVALTDESPSR